MKGKRGRKPVMTPEVQQAILNAIVKHAAPEKEAALLAGVGESTYYRFKAANKEFREAVARARAQRCQALVMEVLSLGKKRGDWRASFSILERLHRDQFGRTDPDIENLKKQFDNVIKVMEEEVKGLPKDVQARIVERLKAVEPREAGDEVRVIPTKKSSGPKAVADDSEDYDAEGDA